MTPSMRANVSSPSGVGTIQRGLAPPEIFTRGKSKSLMPPLEMFVAMASLMESRFPSIAASARGVWIWISSVDIVVSLGFPAAQGMNERNLEGITQRRWQRRADFLFCEQPVLLLAAQPDLFSHLSHEGAEGLRVVVFRNVLAEFGPLECPDYLGAVVGRRGLDILRDVHGPAIDLHRRDPIGQKLGHEGLFQIVDSCRDCFEFRVEFAFARLQAHELLQLLHVHSERPFSGQALISANMA